MATQFTWKCSIPSDGLRDAMERIALQVADEGGYSHVEILYVSLIPCSKLQR